MRTPLRQSRGPYRVSCCLVWSSVRWGSERPRRTPRWSRRCGPDDSIQFTRNNRCAGRLNGHTASVFVIDPQCGGIIAEREDGNRGRPYRPASPIGISGLNGCASSAPPKAKPPISASRRKINAAQLRPRVISEFKMIYSQLWMEMKKLIIVEKTLANRREIEKVKPRFNLSASFPKDNIEKKR